MKHKISNLTVVVIVILTLASCSNSDKKEDSLTSEPRFPLNDTTFATVDIASMLQLTNGEMKMFTLPTPLQVTSVLKKYDIQYTDKYIIPLEQKNGPATSFYNSLLLGMYVIDMGYSITYDDNKRALKYLDEVIRLLDDLSIGNEQSNELMKKFQDNVTQKDSLYKYILDSYNEAHTYFQDEGREGIGLLILTGAYIEGLNITINTDLSAHPQVRDQLLVQQKLFLKNIRELLGFYSSYNHINILLYKLERLTVIFDKIEVEHDGTMSNPYNPTKPVSPEIVDELKLTLDRLRRDILE